MITNENGDVAVCYYQTTPKVIRVNENEYAFVVQANNCLSWIQKQDVVAMLKITKVCCGGSKKKVCRLASDADVRRWTNRGGR